MQANCVSGWIGRFFSWPTFTSSWDCVISAWEGFSLSPFWGEEYNQRHRRPFFWQISVIMSPLVSVPHRPDIYPLYIPFRAHISQTTQYKAGESPEGTLDKKDYTIIKPPETVWFGGEFNIWAFISKISWAVSITLWVALISIILLSDADALLKIQPHSDTQAAVWL